jgi:hypothetical protein
MSRTAAGVVLLGLFAFTSALASRAATSGPEDLRTPPSTQPSAESPTVFLESPSYYFAAPPATDSDLIYRVDRKTGEVGACTFSPKGPTLGSTICVAAGEGAGPQRPGNYALVRSTWTQAKGIYRVNLVNGEVSVCYVLNERVVCTAPSR